MLHIRPPRTPPTGAALFSWPGFGAQQGCCCAEHATLEFQCCLNPGPGHFPQDLAVPFRFRLAGPPQTLLRKLAEFFGGCRHGALRAGNRRERDRSLSHRRLRDAAGDKGQDIMVKTVPIARSGCRHRSDREERARFLILLLRPFFSKRWRDCKAVQNGGCGRSMVDAFDEIRFRPGLRFS